MRKVILMILFILLCVFECYHLYICYLQCVEVWQPNTVSPAQIPSKVVMTDIDGLQVPRLIPEEVQYINSLSEAEAF